MNIKLKQFWSIFLSLWGNKFRIFLLEATCFEEAQHRSGLGVAHHREQSAGEYGTNVHSWSPRKQGNQPSVPPAYSIRLMMCQPKLVLTAAEISPGFKLKAALANSGTILSFVKYISRTEILCRKYCAQELPQIDLYARWEYFHSNLKCETMENDHLIKVILFEVAPSRKCLNLTRSIFDIPKNIIKINISIFNFYLLVMKYFIYFY